MKVEICKFEERHEIGINSAVVGKRKPVFFSCFQSLSAEYKGRNGFNKFLEISSPLMNEPLSISEHERRSLNTWKSDRLYSNEWNVTKVLSVPLNTHPLQLSLMSEVDCICFFSGCKFSGNVGIVTHAVVV